MEYPEELLQKDRLKHSCSDIKDNDIMFSRHKPGYDYDIENDIPDYTKIKIDLDKIDKNQSFNWDKYSQPRWVRFNIDKEYQEDYAVVSYSVYTIRNLNEFSEDLCIDLLDIDHKPIEINYSHCQLLCTDNFKNLIRDEKYTRKQIKKIKNSIRMALKHKSKVILKPFEA